MEVTVGRIGRQQQQKSVLGEEKLQMWDLNKRLESYLSKVKFLEEENELLRGEIDHLKKDQGARSRKDALEEELRQAREQVEEAWRRKDRAELERDNLREEMEGVRAKRHKEITAREAVKQRLRETSKVLEEERRSQIWMREKAAQLEKELQLMTEVHQEETSSLKTQISESSKKCVAPNSFSSSPRLGDLGLDYSARAVETWKMVTEAYQNQMARLEDTLAQARARLAQILEEKKEGYLRAQSLTKELEGARARKEMLEEKVSKQWGRQQRELEKIQAEVERLEREKQSLDAQMAVILSDKQNLTQLKMSLSLEVTTYRVLLDSESWRIQDFKTGLLHKDGCLESSLKELRGRVGTPLTARPQSSSVRVKLDVIDVRGPQCTPPPKPNPKTTTPVTAIDKSPLETLGSTLVDPSLKENIIQEIKTEGFSVMEKVMVAADSTRQAAFQTPGDIQDKTSSEDQGDLFGDDVKTQALTEPAEDNLPSMHPDEPEWGQSFEDQLSYALGNIKDEDRASPEAPCEDPSVVKDDLIFETYRQYTAISQSTALEVSSQACPEVLAGVEASVRAEISQPQPEEAEASKPSGDVEEERVEDSKNGDSPSGAQQAMMEKSKEGHPSRTKEGRVTVEETEKVLVADLSHEEARLNSEDNTETHSGDTGTVKHTDELMKPQAAITTNLVQELKTELHTDQVKLGETDPEDDLCSQEKKPSLTEETGEEDKSLLEKPEGETHREMEAEESPRDLGSTDSSLDTSEDASELNHDEHVETDTMLKGPSQALEPSLSPTAQEATSKTEEIGDSSDHVSSETERDDPFEEEQAAELLVGDQATPLGENKVPDVAREISTEEFVGKTEAELEVFVEKMDKGGNDGPEDDFNLDAQLKLSSAHPDQWACLDAAESPSVSQSWRVEGGELDSNDSYALENTAADTRTLIRYESDEDVGEATVPGSISEDAEDDLIATKGGEEETGSELNISSAKEENEKNDENLASLQEGDEMKEEKHLAQEAGVPTDESEDDSEGEVLPDSQPEEAEEGALEKRAEKLELWTEDFENAAKDGAPTRTVDEHDQGEVFVEGNAEAGKSKDLAESELETEEDSAEDGEVSLPHEKELDLKVDNETNTDRGSHTEPVLEEDTQLELDNEVQKGFHSEELERAQEVESHHEEEEEEESHSKESETRLEGADNERDQESLTDVMETALKGDTEIKTDQPPEDGEFHTEEIEKGLVTETGNLVTSPLGTKVDDWVPVADEDGEDQDSEEGWQADKQSTGSLLDPNPDSAEELIEPVADSGDHIGGRTEEGHQNLSMLTNVDYMEELSLPSDRCNTSGSLSGANLYSEGSYSSEDESPNASQVLPGNETQAETEGQKPIDRQPASDSEDSTADSLEGVASQVFQNEERSRSISPVEVWTESMQPENEEQEVLETCDPSLWQARDPVSVGKEADEGLHKLPGDLATEETVADEYKSSFQNFWESPSSTTAEIDIFHSDPKDSKPTSNGQQRENGDPMLLNTSSINGKHWDENAEAWRSTEGGFLDVQGDASGGKTGLDDQVNPEVQQHWGQMTAQRTEFTEDGGEDRKAGFEGGDASPIRKTEKMANAGEAVSALLVEGDHPQDSAKGVFYGIRGHEELQHSGDSLEEHDSWSSEGE
ncbi:nestin [Polyodon spathula]|uniref:nestin n=1 Tax=Polyodon spathula TaxID=7913 RepID=UPI001B7DAD1A|nr:nestin [Polyodon spathula]